MPDPSAPPESVSLCQECGLCCDGTLFAVVTIESDEVEQRLIQIGARIDRDGSSTPQLQLPCAAHQCGDCVIYADRPVICRNYECRLLRRHERGKISRDDALSVIAETKRQRAVLVAMLQEALGDTTTSSVRELMGRFRDEHAKRYDTIEFRREYAPILLQQVVVDTVLRERFVRPPTGDGSSAESPATSVGERDLD